MTDKEMHLELKKNEVLDNPFDTMLHHSIELTRELLFACHRFANPDVPESLHTNKEKIDFYAQKIKNQLNKLSNMSDETVSMCRETSYYYQNEDFEKMNTALLEFEKNMETVWSKCVPNRNDLFERIRLGEDSTKYKRLIELRHIITESDELTFVNTDYLHSLCDVLSHTENCLKDWMSPAELDEKQKIIKKYNLSKTDIEYMISYKQSLNKQSNNHTKMNKTTEPKLETPWDNES